MIGAGVVAIIGFILMIYSLGQLVNNPGNPTVDHLYMEFAFSGLFILVIGFIIFLATALNTLFDSLQKIIGSHSSQKKRNDKNDSNTMKLLNSIVSSMD